MTDQKSLLHTVFQSLPEDQRVEFLGEIWVSLSPHAQANFLKTCTLSDGSGESDPEGSNAAPMAINSTEGLKENLAQPSLPPVIAQQPQPQKTLPIQPEDRVKAKLTEFEIIHQGNLANQKKDFRKEFFSCLGLGILVLAGLVAASIGLRWVWDAIVS